MAFQYLRDPLFVSCLVLYALNRCVLKPLLPNEFFHSYLNDLICIPFWLPIMLWGMRKAGLRADDAPPQGYEILIPLVMWSVVFELWLPSINYFRHLAFTDALDILCYTVGAVLASLFWGWWYDEQQEPCAERIS